MTTARHEIPSDRVKDCDNLIMVSNECGTPCAAPRELPPGRTLATPGSFVSIDTGQGRRTCVYSIFSYCQRVGGLSLRGWMRHADINLRAHLPRPAVTARPWSRIEN